MVDERGVLVGIVELDNVRNIMFRPELYDRYKVRKIMVTPEVKVSSATPMTEVMRLFDETKAWKMPVVDEEGRYLGFISKSASSIATARYSTAPSSGTKPPRPISRMYKPTVVYEDNHLLCVSKRPGETSRATRRAMSR